MIEPASLKRRHPFRNKDIQAGEIFDYEEFKLQGGHAGYKQDEMNLFSVHEFVWPEHKLRQLAKNGIGDFWLLSRKT